MIKSLIIVARIEAEKEKIEFVKSELLKLIEPTRGENGCIQYDLHQDNDKTEVFLFFEQWENRELWQVHMESDHLKIFLKETEGAIAELVINEMSQIA